MEKLRIKKVSKLEDMTLPADKEKGYRKIKRRQHSVEKQLCEQVSRKKEKKDKKIL